MDDILNKSLEELGLPQRYCLALRRHNLATNNPFQRSLKREPINTVSDILQYSERELRGIRSVGDKAIKKINDVLSENGLTLCKD